uniref:Uncharacterized protein n=1 Tax=Romanomermis culicivorax TaxID=13658 RepID=A0A915L6Z4_ROMCU
MYEFHKVENLLLWSYAIRETIKESVYSLIGGILVSGLSTSHLVDRINVGAGNTQKLLILMKYCHMLKQEKMIVRRFSDHVVSPTVSILRLCHFSDLCKNTKNRVVVLLCFFDYFDSSTGADTSTSSTNNLLGKSMSLITNMILEIL